MEKTMKKFAFVALMGAMLTSCVEQDNPVTPVGPDPTPSTDTSADLEAILNTYLYQSDVDQTCRPGDNFWGFALGGWHKKVGYDGIQGVLSDQEGDALTWRDAQITATSGDPIIAKLVTDLNASKENLAYDQELMHTKFAEIDKAASFDDLAKLMAKLTREGYRHLYELDVLVKVKKSEINFYSPFVDIRKEKTNLKTFGFTQEQNDEIYRLSKVFEEAVIDVITSSGKSSSSEGARSFRSIGRDDWYWNNPDHLRARVPFGRANARADKSYGAFFDKYLSELNLGDVPVFFDNETMEQMVTGLQTKIFSDAKMLEPAKAFLKIAVVFRDKFFYDMQKASDLADRLSDDNLIFLRYPLDRLYAKNNVTDAQRKNVTDMCDEFRKVFAQRIDDNQWLSATTKTGVKDKLDAMHFFVADDSYYLDELIPATPTGKSFVEDCQQLFTNYMSIVIDKVAKGEMNWQKNYWDLAQRNPAYSANAIYNRNVNAIDICLCNCLAPVCDPTLPREYNLAVLGAITIGHEMTHGFDKKGSQFNKDGELDGNISWWAPEDKTKFEALQEKMIKHFSSLDQVPGLKCNGDTTLSENIADLGGLMIAYDVLNNHNKAQGITGDKLKESQAHFFMYFAKAWSSNSSEEDIRKQRYDDVHAPDHLRVNGNVVMLDDWYTLFVVQPTDKSYLKPEDRIRIW